MKVLLKALLSLFIFLSLSVQVFARERQVGLFYFLWLGEHGKSGPWDVSKILAADPRAGYKPNSPVWGPWGAYHHWGEPLYGYYYSDDEWVVRRHIKLIMQSSVDFLFFDTTNAVIYEKNAKLVMRILQEYYDAGWNVPKVMFYTNTASGKTIRRIYESVYKVEYAKDIWFRIDGKPVDDKFITFRVKTQKTIVGKSGEGDFMSILVNGKIVNSLGRMVLAGDMMTLEVPRKALGMDVTKEFCFGFKFVDSTVSCRNPMDWYEFGVVEPLGRNEFKYKGRD